MNTPTPTQTPPGDREATQNATRRAERRGTPIGKVSAQAVREALAQSKSRTHFVKILEEQGIEVGFDRRGVTQEIYGWRLRVVGAEEWLKASTLAKDLSWPKIGFKLPNESQDVKPEPAPVQRIPHVPEMLKPYVLKTSISQNNCTRFQPKPKSSKPPNLIWFRCKICQLVHFQPPC